MNHRLSRRHFMGAGAAALGLPFLGSYAGAGGEPLPRLVIVWTPNDAQWPEEYEVPLEADAPLPAVLPTFLQPYEPFRDRIAVLGDLEDKLGGGHKGAPHSLSGAPIAWVSDNEGYSTGPSVDQYIASALGEEALTLGVWCGQKDVLGRICFGQGEAAVDPIEHPAVAFDNLFADVGAEPEELAAKRQRQHSVLDRIASDLKTFKARAPEVQRPKLEQHLDAVRSLEQKIDGNLLASCDPTMPPIAGEIGNAMIPGAARAQLSIIAQALGCGATRVATLQFGRAGGSLISPMWPEEGLEYTETLHGVAHAHYEQPDDPSVLARALAVERWYSSQIVYLLEQLDAIPEPSGGTLLDNTIVLHVKELGRRHNQWPMTYVAAGGPSLLTGNRVWSFGRRPHNDLLLTLCHKMGVMDETFGDPTLNTGPLPI